MKKVKSNRKSLLVTAVAMSLVMILSLAAGCAVSKTVQSEYYDGYVGKTERKPGYDYDYSVTEGISAPKGGVVSDRADGVDVYPAPGVIEYYYDYDYNGQLKAGTLTAGEIKDLSNLNNWVSIWNEKERDAIRKDRGLNADNVILVTADPLSEVYLKDGDTVLYKAVTDIYGKASLIFPDGYLGKEAVAVSGNNSASVTLTRGAGVELVSGVNAVSAKKLDLLLMIDTTGSMGDELEYIKVELKDMIARVRQEQNVDIRVSVNFYRDEGDDYIVCFYDFREDIDECVRLIGAQHADGGGDTPEAVHTAIENVLDHHWRDDAVKLCFFVLDAPPHSESEIQGINSSMIKNVGKMAEQGIRFMSVVSSGADLEVETLMRSFAVMTGGTYVFLTDDSGIGYDHQTPVDTEFDVEPLNDCMVRVIKDYLFPKAA